VSPRTAIFSIALIGSGWQGLREYFRPLLAFLVFSLVDGITHQLFTSLPDNFSFPQLTANVSGFLLHYLGFNVSLENVSIILPNGSVEVIYWCTGGPLVSLLLQLTLVLFIVAPLNWRFCLKLLAGLVGIGFFLGIARVALLAVVVSDQSAFEFWHGDAGNQIFSLIAFTIWIVIAHFVYEHYENQVQQQQQDSSNEISASQESSLTVSAQSESSRIPFFSGVGIIMTLITLGTFFFPQIGRRQVSPLNFPAQLTLNGWNREKSSPISEENDQVNQYIQQFRSGQRYQYRQNGTQVTVELRHIGATFGNIGNFIGTYSNLGDAYQGNKVDSIERIGDYKLFSDQSHAYLTACITSQGKSTIRQSDFIHKMNRNLLNINSRLLLGIIGKQSLRERNCLWVILSTPLNQNSPEKSYRLLESVFQYKWQSLFH